VETGENGRFEDRHLVGVESANAELLTRSQRLMPPARRKKLAEAVTIDMDSTDVEVYGRRKQGVAYNYAGQRAGRPHLVTWAEGAVTIAAELLAGNQDVRSRAAAMLGRGLAAVPDPVRAELAQAGRVPRVRADAGYFAADLANAAVEAGCDSAIAAKRNTAMWRAYAGIAEEEWADDQ